MAREAEIHIVYGSTEAEPISHLSNRSLRDTDFRRMREGGGLPVGRPVPQIELRIIESRHGESLLHCDEEQFDGLCRPAGESGEIVVSGGHVLPGYVDGNGDSQNKIRTGQNVWHRTGDAGYLDHEGKLWLLGRLSSSLLYEGNRVYPFAIEATASLSAKVRWSAFIEHAGQRCLVIERTDPHASVSLDELGLAGSIVERVRYIDHMPLDPRHNAKIDYPALRHLLRSKVTKRSGRKG